MESLSREVLALCHPGVGGPVEGQGGGGGMDGWGHTGSSISACLGLLTHMAAVSSLQLFISIQG